MMQDSIGRAWLFAAVLSTSLTAGADGGADFVIAGGRIFPVATPPIDDGVVVVRDGRIEAVGPRGEIEIPADLPGIDASGLSVVPGLVDVVSGCLEDESSSPPRLSKAESQVTDVIDPFDPVFGILRREGITTIGLAPFTRGPLRGVGSIVKLRRALASDSGELPLLELGAYLRVDLGAVSPSFGRGRSTTGERLAQYYALRALFVTAAKYRDGLDSYWKAVKKYNGELEAWKKATAPEDETPGEPTAAAVLNAIERAAFAAFADDPPKEEPGKEPAKKKPAPKKPSPPRAPKIDPGKEILVKALTRKLRVFLTAHRRDDIGHALALAKEFELDLTIVGASEGFKQTPALAGREIGAVVGPVITARPDVRYGERRESNCASLAASGVPVAIGGAGSVGLESRYLRQQAAVAVRGGLSRDLALRAVTLEPARLAGVDDRVGSIEPGKDADFVLIDGDPLDATARVDRVIVDGVTVTPMRRRF